MEALWQSYLKLFIFWNIKPGQCVQIRFQISEEYKGISGFESMKLRTQETKQVEDLETKYSWETFMWHHWYRPLKVVTLEVCPNNLTMYHPLLLLYVLDSWVCDQEQIGSL